ncbi:MAG: hypothetical protein U0354_04835 [Candidatus Sericytochromatia bacterium]
MKRIIATFLLVSSTVLISNCQSPQQSQTSTELKWTDALKTTFSSKCEQELAADKTTSETVNIKAACSCSVDLLAQKYPEGAQRFITDKLAAADSKILEDIGKECALKNLKS